MIRHWLAKRADRRGHNDPDIQVDQYRIVTPVSCSHEWVFFHGITGDHARCRHCPAVGDLQIEVRK